MFSAILSHRTGLVSLLGVAGPDGNTYRIKYSPPSSTPAKLTSRQMRHMVVEVADLLAARETTRSHQSGGIEGLWDRVRRNTRTRTLDGGPHGEVRWIMCTDDEQFSKAPGDIVPRLCGSAEPYCYVQTITAPDKEIAGLSSLICTTRGQNAEFQSVLSAIKERKPCSPADIAPLQIVTGLYGSTLTSSEDIRKRFKEIHSASGENMRAHKTAFTESIIEGIVEDLRQAHPLLQSMRLEFFDVQEHQAEVRELKAYMDFVHDDVSADDQGQSAVVNEDV